MKNYIKDEIRKCLVDKKLAKSKGLRFETPNKSYFYDAGTGRVIELDKDIEKDLLNFVVGYRNADNGFKDNLLKGKYDSVIKDLEDNNFLKAGYKKSMYSAPHIENLDLELQTHVSQLILELTERCNLRCKYCIYNEDFSGNRNFGFKDITTHLAIKAIDFAFENSSDELSITYYGGEPLLKFDIIKEATLYAVEKCERLDKSIHFSLTTNLTLMDKEKAEFFASIPNFSILCSIDGPEYIHDAWRVYPNNKPSFSDVMNGYRNLKEAFKRYNKEGISINGVFAPPYTDARLNDIANFFETLGLSGSSTVDLSYPTQGSVDDSEFLKGPSVDSAISPNKPKMIHPIFNWLERKVDEQGGIPADILNKNSLIQTLYLIHKRPISKDISSEYIPFNGCCVPGARRLYVTVNGDFKVCERIGNSPSIGNIYSGFDFSSIQKHYIDDYNNKSMPECRCCWANLLCGVCYANCYNSAGYNIDYKNLRCRDERGFLERAMSIYHYILEIAPEEIEALNDLVSY